MIKTAKLDTKGLVHRPIVYVEKKIIETKVKASLYRALYYIINVLLIAAALATTILTTFVISKLIWDGFPIWFFIATSGITAVVTFVTSILNFFVIKTKYERQKKMHAAIFAEIIHYKNASFKYHNKNNADYILFRSVAEIMQIPLALARARNAQ